MFAKDSCNNAPVTFIVSLCFHCWGFLNAFSWSLTCKCHTNICWDDSVLIQVGHQVTNTEHDTGMHSAYIVSVTHQVFIGTNTFSTICIDRYERYILRPIHVVRSSLVFRNNEVEGRRRAKRDPSWCVGV